MITPATNPVTKAAAPNSSVYISSVSPWLFANDAKISGEPLPKASKVTPATLSLILSVFEMTASAGQKLKASYNAMINGERWNPLQSSQFISGRRKNCKQN